jgi:flagellar hook protein FlgE
MMRSLFSAVSGLKNHQTAMDVIGNNVANVNTIAYKANSVIFQDIVSQTVSDATAASANVGGRNAKQIGLGMSVSTIAKDMTEGSTESTDKPLDFAIHGEGYFLVSNASGTYYTRNGNLTLDDAGNLVTANGDYVQGVLGSGLTGTVGTLSKITIDKSTYSAYAIDSNGIVTGTPKAGGADVQIGRLVLSTFNNPAGLESVGNSNYKTSNSSGAAANSYVNEGGAGALQSGELEMSNVSLASELTNMIIVQRGFQANSRVITTSDTMLEELVNLKR